MNGYFQQVKQLSKPIASRLAYFDIELTERCNNNCIHCCINLPVNDEEARSREMTTDRIKAILEEAARLGCLQVRFTGGEPLLRPDFEELYLCARRSGINVILFTNARLLTPPIADLLARIPPRAPVEVTVYGMRKESYEAVTRAADSFLSFRRGVRLLLEREVPFVVKYALLPQNRSEIDEFEDWARSIPWMTERPHYAMFFDLRNRRDDAGKNELIKSLRVSPQDGVALTVRDPENYRRIMADFALKFMGPPGDMLFRCGAGCGLSVDAYGRARPCMGVHAPELSYNLVPAGTAVRGEATTPPRTPLADALASFENLREVRATNPEYLRRCALCFLKGLCEQCPGKSWEEHGTLDTPVEYLCEVAHAKARWLGWLDSAETGWMPIHWKDRVRKGCGVPSRA